jgi:opacity protein-like surface antigen
MKKVFLFAPLAVLAMSIAAQDVKVSHFIGLTGDNLVFAGSFDGKSYFNTNTDIILVPKIEPGFGAGITYGFFVGKATIDFAYHLTRVEYTSLEDGFSGTANVNTIRYLGVKAFLGQTEGKKLRPYIDVDLSVSYTKFGHIAYSSGNLTESTPATYGGIIFGLGAGVEYLFAHSVALTLNVLPEVYMGTDIKRKGSDRYEVKKFTNFMLLNSLGMRFYIHGKHKT